MFYEFLCCSPPRSRGRIIIIIACWGGVWEMSPSHACPNMSAAPSTGSKLQGRARRPPVETPLHLRETSSANLTGQVYLSSQLIHFGDSATSITSPNLVPSVRWDYIFYHICGPGWLAEDGGCWRSTHLESIRWKENLPGELAVAGTEMVSLLCFWCLGLQVPSALASIAHGKGKRDP